MKRIILAFTAAAISLSSAFAQEAYENYGFRSNWSIGVDGGVGTPLKGHSFFTNMRPLVGIHLQKGISPAFAVGVEGYAGINTCSWETMYYYDQFGVEQSATAHSTTPFDNMYIGAYGALNLFNLFQGLPCNGPRLFDVEVVAGAGWGHNFNSEQAFAPYAYGVRDQNYMVTKAGLNFNFNLSRVFTISLKPSVSFNMTGTEYIPLDIDYTSAGYSIHKASFNCLVGLSFRLGRQFECVTPKDPAMIDELNAKINEIRGRIEAENAATAAAESRAVALAQQLDACNSKKPEVIKEESNNLQSVRYIFYRIGSSKITADQQPNVEMVADYLKNNAKAKVEIKGYASPDGNAERNAKLAEERAESVKTMLIKKYGVSADRIVAKGEGIGSMFSENSWNRVAICTLEE